MPGWKPDRRLKAVLLVAALMGATIAPAGSTATEVTLSGEITYQGSYSGDTLFVAVLDTTGNEDGEILDLKAYAMGAPPFAQGYSLTFDNTGVGPTLVIASFLDVDGGGISDISGVDVFGWYAGSAEPAGVSSAASQGGLDFPLPLAEIRGKVTFAPGQTDAELEISRESDCLSIGFRPVTRLFAEGAYALVGVYAGTYCLHGRGLGSGGELVLCYGDPSCVSPSPIPLGPMDVVTGIDLDFNDVVPAEGATWGGIKARFGSRGTSATPGASIPGKR